MFYIPTIYTHALVVWGQLRIHYLQVVETLGGNFAILHVGGEVVVQKKSNNIPEAKQIKYISATYPYVLNHIVNQY